MSLESRIQKLETLLGAGAMTPVEEECQARNRFAAYLRVRYRMSKSCDDLPAAWGLALTQAMQAFIALPPLSNHPCTSKPRLTDEERDVLRWLEGHLDQRWSCQGRLDAFLDTESMALWARFAPHVPFPLDEG